MVLDADGAHIENFVRDCQSPKTTELWDTNTMMFSM
jgi:hypothetical protein